MSAATFVHIGDAHMGPNGRNEDRWRAIDQIVNENITRDDLAAWLVPGDLNHARMTIEDRNRWTGVLRLIAGRAPVVIVYGNHDLPGDLDVFAKLAAAWPIHVVARPEVLTVTLATGHLGTIFCLPYPTESGLVSAGVAPGDMVPTAYEALDGIFMEAAGKLDAARARGEIALAIGHVNVAGSITSTGQPNIGHEIEVDGYLLGRLGDCYVGLNHIHKAQAIDGAHYPGSICRLDWGETDPKGYLRITYELSPEHEEAGWEFTVETCPLDVAPMFHVEGVLSRDGYAYEVNGAEKPASWKGCEVRARARFPQAEKALLEMAKAHIYAEFAEASRFELELVAVPDTAVRAPEVAAARTLAEKVQAWGTETRTALPAAMLELLPALEHGDADALIAAERGVMGALLDPPAARESEERAVAVA